MENKITTVKGIKLPVPVAYLGYQDPVIVNGEIAVPGRILFRLCHIDESKNTTIGVEYIDDLPERINETLRNWGIDAQSLDVGQ